MNPLEIVFTVITIPALILFVYCIIHGCIPSDYGSGF